MGGGSSWKPKSLNFPLLLNTLPTKKLNPVTIDHILETKISLIAFKQILPKSSLVKCIFSHTIITYSKSSLELNPVIQNCAQQERLQELYSCIPFLTKNTPSFDIALLPAPGVDCSFFPWIFLGNPKDGVRIPPNSETFTYFFYQKNPPKQICILSYQNCQTFPIKYQFSCNASFIFSCLHSCYVICNNYMYTHVSFSITKALNDQSFP